MLIYRGAEAEIIMDTYLGRKVIKKRRIPKGYRIPELDKRLRLQRTKEEAKLMVEARRGGVPVPIIYDVNLKEFTIVMEYVDGERVKELISKLTERERKEICTMIGKNIARLHNANIVHGDLTTSNMILKNGKVYFIDFGLGEFSFEIERRGVDLHLLMEAFSSAHPEYPDLFNYVMEGYQSIYKGNAREIEKKIEEIIKRGRYMK